MTTSGFLLLRFLYF